MIDRRAMLLGGLLAPAAARAQRKAPPPARPRFYARGTLEREVRFPGTGGVTLAGTLLLPIWSEIERVPGVVLVAGSGPTDRNGNNGLIAERVDLLKQIAALLAAAGIATLRYDKRGIGASTQRPQGSLAEQEAFFAWDHFVGDVAAAHAELLRHDEIKSYATALLGHSEGGLLVLAAAPTITRHPPHGMVLVSTPGRPLSVILHEQIARGAPALVAAADKAVAAIQATGHVPTGLPRELALLFPPYAGPFLQHLLAFDPAQALRRSKMPCFLLQGAADTQVVPMADVQPLIDAMGARGAPGEAIVIPGVSHNLKTVTWPSDPGFAGPLAPAAAAKLTAWLTQLLGA
ncbi:alpha/beta hydrolase family protein [Reyranella sp.]|uniref:alpha/beta hydrolase family protein n=1 Tax=Reyranella sp. TaxID=1929291 RepID=UPI003BA9E952